MKIEPHPRENSFIVSAENATDRALLTRFLRCKGKLIIQGSSYACDYSADTDFIFGWVPLDWGVPKEPKFVDGEGWAEEAFL